MKEYDGKRSGEAKGGNGHADTDPHCTCNDCMAAHIDNLSGGPAVPGRDARVSPAAATLTRINQSGIRAHTLTDEYVECVNAGPNVARRGDWIVYLSSPTERNYARVLGIVRDVEGESDGRLSVIALDDNLTSAYTRWVDPEQVREVHDTAPHDLLSFLTQPVETLPSASTLYRLAEYGALHERSAAGIPKLLEEWQAREARAALLEVVEEARRMTNTPREDPSDEEAEAKADLDIQDCPACGHRLYLHRRAANGAYRCASSGCGCEQASIGGVL